MNENHIKKYRSEIDNLLRQSLTFKTSEKFMRFVNFLIKFRNYSCFNNMLVYIQNPEITLYGNPNFWQKNGRLVKHDARPYIILIPHGPVGFVYDIFDTIGNCSPKEFIDKGIGFKFFEVKGQLDKKEFDRIIKRITGLEIDIYFRNMNYFKAGYVNNFIFTDKFEIYLNSDLTHLDNFSTLMHELAHIFLGHTNRDKIYNKEKKEYINLPKRLKLPRKVLELEAETVSYLICSRKGLETSSVEYLAGYITEEEDLNVVSYEMIARATDKIEKLFL